MKILMAAMSMGLGGAETHILELSRALAARGHEVTVASGGGVYAEKLEKLGVRHETVPMCKKEPGAVFGALLALSHLIEKEKFDIVHAHARIPAFICGLLQKKYGFAFITTVHFDFRVTPLLRRLSAWGERTLAVSEDLAEALAKKYGYPREKIAVINNGIDTSRFSPSRSGASIRERFGLCGKNVVMYLGRLDSDSFLPAKALIEAAEGIWQKQSKARFLIVGDGGRRGDLLALAKTVNEKAGVALVLLPGGTERAEEFFAACDVFVGPSRSALEALASGKPTVVAGSFGMLGAFSPEVEAEAVRTNFCCRGSAPTTAERVREEVCRLLSLSEEERSAVGLCGRDFVKKHYSIEAMAERCEAEYRALLGGRGKSAVICGYYGAGNAGDEAMLSVLIAKLRRMREVECITVISHAPEETAKKYGVRALARGDLCGIWRALSARSVLIFGGGNVLQDKTSTRSLCYYAQIAKMAQKRAAKIAFCANGIGPITRGGNATAVKNALFAADYISMRDRRSRGYARHRTGRSDIFASGELAFLAEKSGKAAARKRIFAVFPKDVENFVEAELLRLCLALKRKYGLLPVFAPLHLRKDAGACKRLAKKTGGKLFRGKASLLCRSARLVLTMRLHGAVFAAAERTPFISVSDESKTRALMEGCGASFFGAEATYGALLAAARGLLEKSGEKTKLLGVFAEEQRALAGGELERVKQLFKPFSQSRE